MRQNPHVRIRGAGCGRTRTSGSVGGQGQQRPWSTRPLALSFRELWAHDQAGRAAAFAKLVSGGMPLADAAEASGVLADGD